MTAAGSKQLPVANSAQQKQQELLKQVVEQQFVPKDPPVEFEFIADPPSISALDLYVICVECLQFEIVYKWLLIVDLFQGYC